VLHVPPAVQFLLDVTKIGEMLDVVDGDADFDDSLPLAQRPVPARGRGGDDEPDPEGPEDPPDIVA